LKVAEGEELARMVKVVKVDQEVLEVQAILGPPHIIPITPTLREDSNPE
jgi:hypothetical protein